MLLYRRKLASTMGLATAAARSRRSVPASSRLPGQQEGVSMPRLHRIALLLPLVLLVLAGPGAALADPPAQEPDPHSQNRSCLPRCPRPESPTPTSPSGASSLIRETTPVSA